MADIVACPDCGVHYPDPVEHHHDEAQCDANRNGSVQALLDNLVSEASSNTERSLYAAEKRIGVSDIGGCREYVRRLITDEDFSDPEKSRMPAFMGTAFGRELEAAFKQRYPDAVIQSSINVPIRLRGYQINLPGHPDIIIDDTIIDGKTKNGLAVVRREAQQDDGLQQHKFQLTLYAHACIVAGLLTPECTLALAYYDRSGVEEVPFVVEWKYDEAIYEAALAWLDDVLVAIEHKQAASRDKPREWCFSYCRYATACRGEEDSDVEGLIEDVEIISAIEAYEDAAARAREAAADKKTASAALKGVSGLTATHSLRWVEVGETIIPESKRSAHERISLTKRRRK